MSPTLFDVVVVGAGSGGLNVAGFFQRIGLKVLLVDKSADSIGGDCLNFGCVPSKALIHAARATRIARREATTYGLQVTGAVDLEQVRDRILEKQGVFRIHESAEYFRSLGMTVALGAASFVDPQTICVGKQLYQGKVIVLATGSRPRELTFPGSEQMCILTNETIFANTSLPARLVVVGGGPIGLEIACAYSGFGSQVTVLDRGHQLLPKEDPEISRRLEASLVASGIEVLHGSSVVSAKSASELVIKQGDQTRTIPADLVFGAIGRELNQEGLDVEKAGIALTDRGTIQLNERLQTTNPRVFVIGDLAAAHQFTHAAELHASVVIRNLLSPFKKALNTSHMAWVTFTDPEVATFGASAAELTASGVAFTTLEQSFEEDDRAIVDEYREGYVRVFLDKKGYLLGGTMIAPLAGELIQELILAQTKRIPLTGLFDKVYPYPTATRINRRLAGSYAARRLTDRAKQALCTLFRVLN